MKKLLIGYSPLTTLAGYILAVLLVINDLQATGAHSWKDYLLPAAIALFGRLAADDAHHRKYAGKTDATAKKPFVRQVHFHLRGRVQSRHRGNDGRFVKPAA